MYSIDYESAEALNIIAVSSRDNNNSHIGNATPSNIAKDMVRLIPDDWFEPKGSEVVGKYKLNLDEYANNHRVLDICCNSGVFLYRFLDRFRYALSDYVAKSFDNSEDKLCEFIIKNLLYGVCVDYSLCKKIRGILYNNQNVYGNIYHYSVLHKSKCDDDAEFRVEDNKVYIGEEEMKFDVVVGNPPYNNDMYLDFVMLGHKLAKQYDLWITPAKFMLSNDDNNKNEEFRNGVVPYMMEIVHYQNEADIFRIVMPCGVCYYLCDKNTHIDKYITNKSLSITVFNNKRVLYSNFKCRDSLLVVGHNILQRVSLENILTTKVDNRHFKVFATKALRGFYLGGSDKHVYTATPVTRPLYLYPYTQVASNARVLFSSDDENECKSYMRYVETKFIRFMILLSATGYSFGVEFGYSLVPSPLKFDKIFEDNPLEGYEPDENGEYIDSDGNKHCSLYVKYKLTDEEINVIESVIRERK